MKLPILVTLPHGKITLPPDVREQVTLSDEQILENYCDYGSDQLFFGKMWHVVDAQYSRLFCDLNRPRDDWSHSLDLKRAGVVRQKTESGEAIYKESLTEAERVTRIIGYDGFYARCLQVIMDEHIEFFIAGHTMEDYPLGETPTRENKRSDVVISTNKFQTCDEVTAYLVADAFRQQGFTVQIDKPFLGGHLLTDLCSVKKLPGVQLELRRGLFSASAHDINTKKLQDAGSRVQKAILQFWHIYSIRKEIEPTD